MASMPIGVGSTPVRSMGSRSIGMGCGTEVDVDCVTLVDVGAGGGAVRGSETGTGGDGGADGATGVRTMDLRVPADVEGGTVDVRTVG